jgi:hypothetical protein
VCCSVCVVSPKNWGNFEAGSNIQQVGCDLAAGAAARSFVQFPLETHGTRMGGGVKDYRSATHNPQAGGIWGAYSPNSNPAMRAGE